MLKNGNLSRLIPFCQICSMSHRHSAPLESLNFRLPYGAIPRGFTAILLFVFRFWVQSSMQFDSKLAVASFEVASFSVDPLSESSLS